MYINASNTYSTWDESEPLDDEAGRRQMHEARRPPHEHAQARRHDHTQHLIHVKAWWIRSPYFPYWRKSMIA